MSIYIIIIVVIITTIIIILLLLTITNICIIYTYIYASLVRFGHRAP